MSKLGGGGNMKKNERPPPELFHSNKISQVITWCFR